MYPIPIGSQAEVAVNDQGVVVLEVPNLEGRAEVGIEIENTGDTNALTGLVVQSRQGPDSDYEDDLGAADWEGAADHPRIISMSTNTPHDLAAGQKCKLQFRTEADWGIRVIATSTAGTTVRVSGNAR